MSGRPDAGDRPDGGRRRGRRLGSSPDPDGPDAARSRRWSSSRAGAASSREAGPSGAASPDADDVAAPGAPEDDLGDPEQVARSVCLRALTGAPKTRRQLADLLAKRGVPEDAAERVLERFGEVGLIDDAAFARAWVTSRQVGRGLARRALKAELRAKGVDGEVAEDALSLVDDEDEWAAARRLVERRVPGLRRFDRPTAERRLVGMLARKGYGSGLAAWVVREALDADRAEEPDGGDAAGDRGDAGLDAWLP